MANHPNRNWRRVMRDATDAYIAQYPWSDGGVHVMTPEQLRELLCSAHQAGYVAGYDAGREAGTAAHGRPRKPEPHHE